MSLSELIGKRILAKIGNSFADKVEEYKILEISPNEKWVKLQNLYGSQFWKEIDSVKAIDVLRNLKDGKPKD